MNTVARILQVIGRFLAAIARGILQLTKRFTSWWLTTFKSQSTRGKVVFGGLSLLVACCLFSFGAISVLPSITPTPVVEIGPSNEERMELQVTATAETDATDTPPPTVTTAPTETIAPTATAKPSNTPRNTPRTTPTIVGIVSGGGNTPRPSSTPRGTDAPTATPAAATSTQTPAPPVSNAPASEQALVTNIIDGDTIDVSINGQVRRVRYIGINTPERGEPFYSEATNANAALVAGQTVILVKDVSETDRFGRLLRYVYLLDGTFVNAELVGRGYALAATYPPDVAHADEFVALEAEARSARVGLWGSVVDALPTATDPPPLATNTPVPQSTEASAPTEPPAQPTEPPAPEPGRVVISYIFFDGVVPRVESDEYAMITNQGGSPVNLGGWRLNAGNPGQDFVFPGYELLPGASCRVYTNEHHPDYCGFSYRSGQALWNNNGDCGYLFDASGALVSEYCY